MGGIASARRLFQTAPAQHDEFAAPIFDEPGALQYACGGRNTHSAHAEHVCQELMRHMEVIGMGSILHHEQPAGEPWTDEMKP